MHFSISNINTRAFRQYKIISCHGLVVVYNFDKTQNSEVGLTQKNMLNNNQKPNTISIHVYNNKQQHKSYTRNVTSSSQQLPFIDISK